jgi:hypothetical protein
MHDPEKLAEVGRAAAPALASQADWVHRRVERISFPSPEEPVYRRHVSVDFTIPSDLLPAQDSDESLGRYYVPLSLVLKWPPLLRLDLRDAVGCPIPFLTGAQNAALDGAVLEGLAEKAIGRNSLSGEIQAAIQMVTADREVADRGLRMLLPAPNETERLSALDADRKALRRDPVFVGAAGGLRDSTFLWLRVAGSPGDREIVKFAYDIPMEVRVGSWSAASFGFRAFIAEFDSPHIGSSSSYHLTISAPAPIKVVDSELRLHTAPEIAPETQRVSRPIGECSAATSPVKEDGRVMFTEPMGDQGRFYLTGERSGCVGEARVALIADKSLARSGSLAAFLIAALITAYAWRLPEILQLNEAAVTLALAAPALLAYLLVRPAPHEFARGFTAGIRRTLALSGLLPILGAAAIVLSGGEDSPALCTFFKALSSLAWLAAVILLIGALLPVGKRARPLSSYMTNGSAD